MFRIVYWKQEEQWFIPRNCLGSFIYLDTTSIEDDTMFEIKEWAEKEAAGEIIVCYGQESPVTGEYEWMGKMLPKKIVKVYALDQRDLVTLKLKFHIKGVFS